MWFFNFRKNSFPENYLVSIKYTITFYLNVKKNAKKVYFFQLNIDASLIETFNDEIKILCYKE